MPFKVQVGPPQIAVHQGQTVLVADPDGQVGQPSDKGLYFFDTRVISHWKIYANGEPWELLNGGPTMYYAARIFLSNRVFLTEDGPVPRRTLGLVLGRSVSGGLHEDLDLTNYGAKPVRFQLEIALRSDFADIFEVKANRIVRRGRITTDWSEQGQELVTMYRHADFCR
jgi:glycogen debranching enzyme